MMIYLGCILLPGVAIFFKFELVGLAFS
uniref:Uncharacterized protein n=1 Tax=Rhizophora mucronata TaxID=61149 RepID=A0A2P2NM85_RHIMU